MKYLPGLLAGQLSGKAGNTVASRNKFGSYFRTRVNPMLVQNSYTGAVRANFGGNSQAWRTLTEAQRTGWTALGASISRTNSLGQTYHPTGAQMYNSVNRNIFTYGGTALAAAPVYTAPATLVTVTPTATA